MRSYQNLGDLFRSEIPAEAQPDPKTWQRIRRRMKRVDFWQTKGKTTVGLLAGALLVGGLLMFALAKPKSDDRIIAEAQLSGTTEAEHRTETATGETITDETARIAQDGAAKKETRTYATADSRKAEQANSHSAQANSHSAQTAANIPAQTATNIPAQTGNHPAQTATNIPTQTGSHPMQTATNIPAQAVSHPTQTTAPVQPAAKPEAKPGETAHNPTETTAPERADSLQIAFPSAFTPNGDGLNDVYKPVISGETDQYLLRIFNNNQQLLFQTSHQQEAWDGTFRGREQAHGLYIYTLHCTDKQGRSYVKRGEFLLLRH